MKFLKKFTLIEYCIALAIVGILVLVVVIDSIRNVDLSEPKYDLQVEKVSLPNIKQKVIFTRIHNSGKYSSYYIYTDIGRLKISSDFDNYYWVGG